MATMTKHTPVIKKGTRPKSSKNSVVVKLNRRGTVTLPKEFRANWPDDVVLELVLRANGVIEVRPRVLVDPEQAWFWTEEWQQKEREADADLWAGRFAEFDDVESFLADLDAPR